MDLDLECKNILVIGDLMLDHYIYGNCSRISPEAPVPIVEITKESYTLGGAGNVLKNLSSFGCNAHIISVVGDDDFASVLISQLAQYNIASDGIIKDADRCTIMKSRVLAVNHQLIRLDREKKIPLPLSKETEIVKYLKDNSDSIDMLLISDYDKGLLTPSLLQQIFDVTKSKNLWSIVDPKGADFSKYYGADIIKPNKKEASIATGITITDTDSLERACIKLQEITGCKYVIITMSEEGMAYYFDDELTLIPTKVQDVVDVTGAGDTVLAALGVALASGHTLSDACNFANKAAAIVVNKVGTATATIEEIRELL